MINSYVLRLDSNKKVAAILLNTQMDGFNIDFFDKRNDYIKSVSIEEVEEGKDYLIIIPPKQIKNAEIDTYEDHRMAMAFSLAACGDASVTINDPGCVSKTFPEYFEVFSGLCS